MIGREGERERGREGERERGREGERGGEEKVQRKVEEVEPLFSSEERSRSPRHSQSTQSGLADQAAKLSFASAESLAETMSEADIPLGFSRTNRFRQSLPLLDTLHALIVHMFPQKLTAGMLKSPNTAILIKDEARNVFYELEDIRDIQDRSIIKIYRKEPIYASYPATHLVNGDLRRDLVYTSRESSPTRRLNTLPSSSASPPSGSPSRSRLSYSGGRPPSFAGPGSHPQHQQHPQQHQPQHSHHPGAGSHHGGPNAGLSSSPSAILERRDVKPDEEVSGKNMMLVKNEGLYADPYSLVHEGRLSIASTQSLAAIGDPFGFPVSGGLYRRGSVRSLSTYSAAALQGELEDALYKPGGPVYSDSYSSATLGMGFRMPPSSPQKIPDMQLRDRGDSYSSSPSRASPVRQTFRKDSTSSSMFVESPKSRPSSSSDPLALQAGSGGDGSRFAPGYSSPLPGETSESRDRMERLDRMEAMEKQIASLTGLVQSVLTKAPDSDSTCGLLRLCMMAGCPPDQGSEFSRPFPFSSSEKTESNSDGSATGNTQLQNQDSVKTLLKRTEKELNVRVSDALRKQEDPLQRQRLLVEEERLKYLNEEELIIQQLHDLEKSVEDIQKGSAVNHKLVTVQELEEKASLLRKLGETLTELKNQFPSLQSKMRVVLRVEVEAVKFLKEEPHRLDALLKRCKSVTDTLTTMRRQVNEGIWKKQEDFPKHSGEDFRKSSDFDMPTSPPLNLSDLRGGSSLSNWCPHSSHSHSQSHGHGHSNPSSGPHRDNHPPVPHKGRALEELANRAAADKAVSVEVRLYSAQDINRLLEETQAELMKAIPDLDFAAKQINKPSSNTPSQSQTPQSGGGTPEHRPTKPQHATHKLSGKEPGSRRGSAADGDSVSHREALEVAPSPATSTQLPIIPSEAEEAETQKPHVQLRRTVSENPRPASTPPTIASGDKEEGEEDKITAELELFQRAPLRLSHTPPLSPPSAPRSRTSVPPSSLNLWPPVAQCTKYVGILLLFTHFVLHAQSMALPGPSFSPVPRIVLTECMSVPLSPSEGFVRELTQDHQMSLTVDQSQSQTAPPQAVPQIQVSKRKDPVSQAQRKPSRRGELRIQESFEKEEEREEREELSLVLTELEVRVMSPSQAQELSRTMGEALQTLTIPTQPSEGTTEARLCGAPLLVLFRETVTVREAYRQLQLLLGRVEDTGSSKAVPKPRAGPSHSSLSSSPSPLGSRITLSPEQQVSLREALRRGVETGDRNLTLPHSSGTESILATLPEPSQDSAEAAVNPNGSAGFEESQAREGQGQNPCKRGQDIRSSTYRRLDNLEETIRELENTLLELSGHPTTLPTDTALSEAPDPAQMPGTSTTETKKPPVPPKPKPSFTPSMMTKGGNSSSAVGKVHSSAASRLKHLQQSSTEKTKTGKREDFLKGQQQALGNSSSSIKPLLSGTKADSFSGRLPSSSSASAVFAPGLRKYPQEGALSSLTASSSQAKALLASLSASSLSAEALLLSSTFRQHRLLREQQRASSLPLPNGRSSNSTTTSTTTSSSSSSTSPTSTTPTPTPSPSSPTPLTSLNLSSLGLKPGGRSLQYSGSNSYKERGSKTLPKPVSPSNSQ
ncbi:unnamed protein product [Coregonus sp. 'balchen']|nr:unnamed protein product [Coregonus sp. 'balchen']